MDLNITDEFGRPVDYIHTDDAGEVGYVNLSRVDGGLGDPTRPHHGGMTDTPSLLTSKHTPEKALFVACHYHDWENPLERESFKKRVKLAVEGIFDGSKTWYKHSPSEKARCVAKFSFALNIEANENDRLYKVCVAYLKQRCDNQAKYKPQKTPLGSNTGPHASPLPLDPAASAEGFMDGFMITANNDEVEPQFNIPQQGFEQPYQLSSAYNQTNTRLHTTVGRKDTRFDIRVPNLIDLPSNNNPPLFGGGWESTLDQNQSVPSNMAPPRSPTSRYAVNKQRSAPLARAKQSPRRPPFSISSQGRQPSLLPTQHILPNLPENPLSQQSVFGGPFHDPPMVSMHLTNYFHLHPFPQSNADNVSLWVGAFRTAPQDVIDELLEMRRTTSQPQ